MGTGGIRTEKGHSTPPFHKDDNLTFGGRLAFTTVGSTRTDGTCIAIGTSGTPITSETVNGGAVKVYSDFSLTTAGYLVGAWFQSRYTADGAGIASLYTLRGHVDFEGTQTSSGTAQYIIGVHGRAIVSGTVYNSGLIISGVLGQLLTGGTWTSVEFAQAIWADWQNSTQIVSGNTQIIYLSNNADNGNYNPTNVMYVYAPYVTNFFKLYGATNGGMVSAASASASHGTLSKKIRINIDGTTFYLLASTVPT